MKRRLRSAILLGSSVMVFGVMAIAQTHLTRIKGANWTAESMSYLPNGEEIRPFLLGFESTFAHYLWIRTVLYFGSHYIEDKNYPWLIHMLDIITKLHPHFSPAYEFAGLLVPDLCGNADAARVILERGVSSIGNKKWNIHFHLGMLYYKYYADQRNAAYHFWLASKVPSPHQAKLASLSASMYNKIGDPEQARSVLSLLYQSTESPGVRTYLLEKWKSISLENSGLGTIDKQSNSENP